MYQLIFFVVQRVMFIDQHILPS